MVKLSHLLASGKVSREVGQNSTAWFDSTWEYKLVDDYPADVMANMEIHRRILKLSWPSQDLSLEEE